MERGVVVILATWARDCREVARRSGRRGAKGDAMLVVVVVVL